MERGDLNLPAIVALLQPPPQPAGQETALTDSDIQLLSVKIASRLPAIAETPEGWTKTEQLLGERMPQNVAREVVAHAKRLVEGF